MLGTVDTGCECKTSEHTPDADLCSLTKVLQTCGVLVSFSRQVLLIMGDKIRKTASKRHVPDTGRECSMDAEACCKHMHIVLEFTHVCFASIGWVCTCLFALT